MNNKKNQKQNKKLKAKRKVIGYYYRQNPKTHVWELEEIKKGYRY